MGYLCQFFLSNKNNKMQYRAYICVWEHHGATRYLIRWSITLCCFINLSHYSLSAAFGFSNPGFGKSYRFSTCSIFAIVVKNSLFLIPFQTCWSCILRRIGVCRIISPWSRMNRLPLSRSMILKVLYLALLLIYWWLTVIC